MVQIKNRSDFIKRLKIKLKDHKRFDREHWNSDEYIETISIKDIISLVDSLESDICPECGCVMLFCDYKPHCLYQFSLDRLDNCKFHTKDNLRVVCWNCNSGGYGCKKITCLHGCHIGLLPTREVRIRISIIRKSLGRCRGNYFFDRQTSLNELYKIENRLYKELLGTIKYNYTVLKSPYIKDFIIVGNFRKDQKIHRRAIVSEEQEAWNSLRLKMKL